MSHNKPRAGKRLHHPAKAELGQPTSYRDNSRALLAAIVESSDDAIVSKDLEGTITSWNGAATRMFGYTPEEIIGHSVLQLIPPELHFQEPIILAKLRAGERIEHFETQRVRKNGDIILVALTISPVKDDSGTVIGASKIVRDITQLKRMEQSLLEAEKLAVAGRMAATVAHEINNPLESIFNLIYLARTDDATPKKVRQYLELAEREIERVSHIARQTLGFYRDTSSARPLCLHDVAEDVLQIYQSKLDSRHIRVVRDYHPIPEARVRRGQLVQVLSNVISNAIDAMPGGGELRIRIREATPPDRRGIAIEIQDTGVGIRQQDLSRLFDPFFTTKTETGNGLGLWVVKQFVSGHGGTVAVTSSPGKGTTFLVCLPLNAAESVNLQSNLTLQGTGTW